MFKEITIFFTALVFFTRIPCYKLANYSPEYLSKTFKYLPLVGWIVGGVGALVFWTSNKILPHSIAVLFSMIATILLTGAFHEDGFADSCDGFGGGYTREKILEIMKDSRIGAYGAIGIILMLALKFLCLISIKTAIVPLVLVAGHSISRFIAASFTFTHKYIKKDDSKGDFARISILDIFIAGIFGIAPVFLLGYVYLLLLIPVFITRQIASVYLSRRLGGYTGDSLGAVQQITEVIFYIFVLIAPWKYI